MLRCMERLLIAQILQIGWMISKKYILPLYKTEDILNAEETALFYRMKRGHTLILLGESHKGLKLDKASEKLEN